MRDIKFRGLSISGEWRYGNVSVINSLPCKALGIPRSIHMGTYISNSSGQPFAFEVRPETISQFTGFIDTKGEDIYEGDRLNILASDMSCIYVVFQSGCFMGEGPFNTLPLKDYFTANDFGSCEIVGNVWTDLEKKYSRF